MERVTGDGSIVFLEDRFFPLVIATWVGPASESTAQAFFEWHHKQHARGAAEGRRFYSISDATLSGRPSPEVRRLFAEDVKMRSEEAEKAGKTPEELELSSVVITNRLLRGALTAIGWVAPSMKNLHSAATVQESLTHMLERMAEDGVARPEGLELDGYESPAFGDDDARKLSGMQDAG
jgi:hypothetical protein